MKGIFEIINENLEGKSFRGRGKSTNSSSPIITISREQGSGGRPIAYLVAKKLGTPWRVYHNDIVDELAYEATRNNVPVEPLDEHQSSAIKDLLNTAFGKKILSMDSHNKNLLHILAAIGTRGHVVIVGSGANFLFPKALNIRIISTMEDRINAMIKYEHVSAKEAKKQIEESDKTRSEFITTIFQHDVHKAHHYDFVIRTGKNINIENTADVIVYLAKKKFK